MNTTPTYEELVAEIYTLRAREIMLKERIAFLERRLFGAKSDRLTYVNPDDQPGLFDEMFKEAMDEKASQIDKMADDIEKESQKRRKSAKKKPCRPAKYRYTGLEERTTTMMPGNINIEEYDIIGKDVSRILHYEKAKVWVEIIERPIFRRKEDNNSKNDVKKSRKI